MPPLTLLDSEEDDDQREERERFDERQAENQQGLDAGAGAGVARYGFHGAGGCLALSQSAKSCS